MIEKKTKNGIIAILLLITMCVSSVRTYAYDRVGHDKALEKVLFGNEKYSSDKDESIIKAVKALKCASYLAIDQYNGKGEEDIKFLKDDFKVPGIPELSKIDFSSNSKHRRYTHRGWDYTYHPDNANWEKRKGILLNTVNKEFKFKKSPNEILGRVNKKYLEYDEKCDSFCALIYYIHIIGDHIDNKTYAQFKANYPNQMKLGGRDEENIIAELLKHTEILFDDQSSSNKYTHLRTVLTSLNGKIKRLLSEGDINTEEKYFQYIEYAKELENILSVSIPNLLKEEEFFKKVYYS